MSVKIKSQYQRFPVKQSLAGNNGNSESQKKSPSKEPDAKKHKTDERQPPEKTKSTVRTNEHIIQGSSQTSQGSKSVPPQHRRSGMSDHSGQSGGRHPTPLSKGSRSQPSSMSTNGNNQHTRPGGSNKHPQKPNSLKDPSLSNRNSSKNKYKSQANFPSKKQGSHGNINQRLKAVSEEENDYNRRQMNERPSEFCAYGGVAEIRNSTDNTQRRSYAQAAVKPGLVRAQLREEHNKGSAFGSRYQSLAEEPMDSA